MIQPKVTTVRGEILYANRSDSIEGYRYTADREDLSSEVILNDGFIRYDWAYQWAELSRSRGRQTALAAGFTFSSGGGRQSNLGALSEFRIKW